MFAQVTKFAKMSGMFFETQCMSRLVILAAFVFETPSERTDTPYPLRHSVEMFHNETWKNIYFGVNWS